MTLELSNWDVLIKIQENEVQTLQMRVALA